MARIYVVEADAGVRAEIVRTLDAHRHEVLVARSGRTALSHLESEIPDLVIGDVDLPDLDGAMISTFVRQSPILQSTPVLLLSADASKESYDQAIRSGASDVLLLSSPPEALLAAVDRLLATAEEQHAPSVAAGLVAVRSDDPGDETLPALLEEDPPSVSSPGSPPVSVAGESRSAVAGVRRLPPPELRYLADILDDLAMRMDLRFACILHTSGEVVRSEGSAPWLAGTAAEELIRLALLAGAVSSKVGHGKVAVAVVESAGGTLLIEGLPEQHLLVLGVPDASSLGKARYLLRQLRQRLLDGSLAR